MKKEIIILKYLFITFILFISSSVIASVEWSEWKEIKFSQVPLKIDISINNEIGDTSFQAWRMNGNFNGKKAFLIWLENNSNIGKLIIEYTKYPPGWAITGSENDRKYLISNTARMLGLEKKNNPLKNLKKNEIERYRDMKNNVVPFTFFENKGNTCVIFNKGFYKVDDGFRDSALDDETISAVFCKNSGTISKSSLHILIDAIQRE